MAVDFKKIYELREQLNELLEQRPEMKYYQEFIDKELEKAGDNPHNRCAVLENLLRDNQKKLREAWQELQHDCKKLKKLADRLKEDE
ncbi:MAG TPA: hypothetical protein VI911_11940 [Patescibacteria group bacterium]|nr:hypothetical protein [Patescibacteria group bacterium]